MLNILKLTYCIFLQLATERYLYAMSGYLKWVDILITNVDKFICILIVAIFRILQLATKKIKKLQIILIMENFAYSFYLMKFKFNVVNFYMRQRLKIICVSMAAFTHAFARPKPRKRMPRDPKRLNFCHFNRDKFEAIGIHFNQFAYSYNAWFNWHIFMLIKSIWKSA